MPRSQFKPDPSDVQSGYYNDRMGTPDRAVKTGGDIMAVAAQENSASRHPAAEGGGAWSPANIMKALKNGGQLPTADEAAAAASDPGQGLVEIAGGFWVPKNHPMAKSDKAYVEVGDETAPSTSQALLSFIMDIPQEAPAPFQKAEPPPPKEEEDDEGEKEEEGEEEKEETKKSFGLDAMDAWLQAHAAPVADHLEDPANVLDDFLEKSEAENEPEVEVSARGAFALQLAGIEVIQGFQKSLQASPYLRLERYRDGYRFFYKAGIYYGPRGGKYADPEHKIPWREGKHSTSGEAKEGSSVNISHGGAKGRFNVKKREGDMVHLEHHETGKTVKVHKDELTKLTHKANKKALRDKQKRHQAVGQKKLKGAAASANAKAQTSSYERRKKAVMEARAAQKKGHKGKGKKLSATEQLEQMAAKKAADKAEEKAKLDAAADAAEKKNIEAQKKSPTGQAVAGLYSKPGSAKAELGMSPPSKAKSWMNVPAGVEFNLAGQTWKKRADGNFIRRVNGQWKAQGLDVYKMSNLHGTAPQVEAPAGKDPAPKQKGKDLRGYSSKKQLANAIAGKFPKQNKMGGLGKQKIMLTGNTASALGKDQYDSVMIHELPLGDLAKLADVFGLKKGNDMNGIEMLEDFLQKSSGGMPTGDAPSDLPKKKRDVDGGEVEGAGAASGPSDAGATTAASTSGAPSFPSADIEFDDFDEDLMAQAGGQRLGSLGKVKKGGEWIEPQQALEKSYQVREAMRQLTENQDPDEVVGLGVAPSHRHEEDAPIEPNEMRKGAVLHVDGEDQRIEKALERYGDGGLQFAQTSHTAVDVRTPLLKGKPCGGCGCLMKSYLTKCDICGTDQNAEALPGGVSYSEDLVKALSRRDDEDEYLG